MCNCYAHSVSQVGLKGKGIIFLIFLDYLPLVTLFSINTSLYVANVSLNVENETFFKDWFFDRKYKLFTF